MTYNMHMKKKYENPIWVRVMDGTWKNSTYKKPWLYERPIIDGTERTGKRGEPVTATKAAALMADFVKMRGRRRKLPPAISETDSPLNQSLNSSRSIFYDTNTK
jgi:hypothetical protein